MKSEITSKNQVVAWIEQQKKLIRKPETKFLRHEDSEELANKLAVVLQLSFTRGLTVTNTAITLGRAVAPEEENVDVLFHIGMTLIYVLCKKDILDLQRGSAIQARSSDQRIDMFKIYRKTLQKNSKKGDWSPKMLAVAGAKNSKRRKANDIFITSFINCVPVAQQLKSRAELTTDKPLDWDGFYHEEFGPLVPNANRRLRRLLTIKKQPKLFRTINKIQRTGFRINSDVLKTILAKKRALVAELGIGNISEESLNGKLMELNKVISLAREFENKVFYSAIQLDFRGRLYYSAAYLNRGGSDLAKGLIMAETGEALTLGGWDNLLVAAVTLRAEAGQDKFSKVDKLDIADNDLDIFIAIGNDSVANDIWMGWDEPVQGLGVCIEIAKAYNSGNEVAYECSIFIGLDASTSGPMQMGIATMDYNTMKLTNVLSNSTRFDPYAEVGGRVKQKLGVVLSKTDFGVPQELNAFHQVIYSAKHKKEALEAARMLFGELFKDDAALRDWMKVPVMIIGYSAEEMCVAEALWDKYYSKIDWLTPLACKFLSDIIFEAYAETLPACMQVMEGLKKLGGIVHKMDQDFYVESVFDGFPMLQDYRKATKGEVDFTYKGKKITFSIITGFDKRNYHDTVSGIGPNFVHNLDATFLRMVAYSFGSVLALNHDAFYTIPSRVNELGILLRAKTYEFGTKYDLLNNALERYNVTPKELGIDVHPINEEFQPQENDYCYS